MKQLTNLLIVFCMLGTLSACTDQAEVKNMAKAAVQSDAPKTDLMTTLYKSPEPPPARLVEGASSSGELLRKVVPGEPVSEFWEQRGEVGRFGGTLTVAIFGQGPKTFNYWFANDVESSGLCQLMFEHLIELDPWTGQYYGRLAKSFSFSPDKKTLTVTLRKGLVWSDGQPLNADDVVFTFKTIIGHGFGNSSFRDVLSVDGHYLDVQKVDDLTINLTSYKPFAPLMNGMRLAIAPKHIMEKLTKQQVSDFDKFWNVNCDPKSIVGSGPFMLGRYVPGQRVELVRNPKYSYMDKAGQRLPYLDKFVETIVPDQNTEILKFYGNEIDFLDIRSIRGIDAAKVKSREKSDQYTLYNLGPDDGTMFLMFNMNTRKNKDGKFYVQPVKQKWFNNLFFRQAVAHAIDRKRIVNNVLRGVGLPLYTSESPAALYFDKELKPYPQDLKLAADLLKKGGFVLRDGALYDADKNRVEFNLTTNTGNSQRDGTCIMVAEALTALGMKVNYQPIDFNILIDKTETSLDWEAVVMGLTGDKIEPYNGANTWKSDGRLHMFNQRLPNKDGTVVVTDALDWEKEIDKCFNLGALTFDTAERHKLFDRYQAIAYENQPFIYLYSVLTLTAMRNKVGNYVPTPWGIYYTPKGTLHNIEEIYIKGRGR